MGQSYSLVTVATSVLLLGLHVSPSLAAVSTSVAQQYRINLRVTFRAFCSACQWYIEDPLLKLIGTQEYRNIIDLTLLPTAGMIEEPDGTITCEAGSLECTGHRWQVCVLHKNRDDIVKYLGTIVCIEGDESGQIGDWATKMNNCVAEEERVATKECFDHKSKDLLLNVVLMKANIVDAKLLLFSFQMIREEQSGSIPWMPYTVVNHKVIGSATKGVSLKMLKTNICLAYTGPKTFYPAECVKLVGEQKKFAPEDTVTEKGDNPLVAPEGKPQGIIALAKEAINTEIESSVIESGDGKDMENVAVPAPAFVPATAKKSGKVQMELYWRAFCPGCTFFITKQLLSLIRDKEYVLTITTVVTLDVFSDSYCTICPLHRFQEIIDFHPVPAAGMSYDAKGKFVCAAGRVECLGHKWLSCAVEEFQQIGELVEHIACMESKDNKGMTWSSVMSRCFDGEALTKMKTCYGSKSVELLQKNVAKMQALRVSWMPYVRSSCVIATPYYSYLIVRAEYLQVLINGVPLGTAKRGISLKQLMDAVCKAYSGPQNLWPASCQPKRLREEATEPEPPAEKEDAVKPCTPKEKDADITGAQHVDIPGIGKALPSEPVAKTITKFEAKVVGGKEADDEEVSATFIAIILPGVCFVGLLVVALRLTRDHKKDA
ncbi:hypothetical protein DD238_000498 [Peronospora effusa]|uniref:Thioredoxin domain-containing protein n=1 Tax=Peronospora effusa TaxID=542832 RepID=A0A3M6VM72_9STRA|nr:hypothetical protein DD238_000498 [Peronospora effusa]RQM17658.1 hypothetical protein DD237_000664 [Peronospora effusa]